MKSIIFSLLFVSSVAQAQMSLNAQLQLNTTVSYSSVNKFRQSANCYWEKKAMSIMIWGKKKLH